MRDNTNIIDNKSKKVKRDIKDDKEIEGQGGFDHLNEFFANIQQLNDGNLSFDLDVSREHFKLRLSYNFE